MYISYRKEISRWAIGYTTRKYNHRMNLDSFAYFVHRSHWVGHDKAREIAKELWEEVSYKKAQHIPKNHDLTIDRKEFYNLTRKEATKKPKP